MIFNKENSLFIISLILLAGPLGLYSLDIFKNQYTKLMLLLLILWGSTVNIYLTIFIGVIVLIIYQILVNRMINEPFQPSDIDGNNYLQDPLLMRDDLEKIDSLDLIPVTPREYNENMIKEGKGLLNQVYNMQDDLKQNYDVREDDIMNVTKRDALVLIKSGENGLENANMGEYYNGFLKKNQKINWENEYTKLLNDKSLTREQFDEKLKNIYNNLNIQ